MLRCRPLALACLAGAGLVVACNRFEAPWPPVLRRGLTGHDYALYSAWLADQRPAAGGTVLVDDRTTGGGYPGLSVVSSARRECETGVVVPPPVVVPPGQVIGPSSVVCSVPEREVALAPSQPVPDDETSQDFRLQQELSLPLERRLTGAVYDLVHDPVPGDLLARAKLIMVFSRVGFDRRLERATFRVLQARVGEGGRPGLAASYSVWAERRARRWKLVEVQQAPSPPGSVVGIGTPVTATCDSVRTTTCIPGPVLIPIPIPLPLRPPK